MHYVPALDALFTNNVHIKFKEIPIIITIIILFIQYRIYIFYILFTRYQDKTSHTRLFFEHGSCVMEKSSEDFLDLEEFSRYAGIDNEVAMSIIRSIDQIITNNISLADV